jgi:hypothetical protein
MNFNIYLQFTRTFTNCILSSSMVISDDGQEVIAVSVVSMKALAISMDYVRVLPLIIESSVNNGSDVQLCCTNMEVCTNTKFPISTNK